MSPFLSGALGAAAVLFAIAVLRRALWIRWARRAHGGRLPLRHLFRRLRTRPEQERVITEEADALAGELRALRDGMRSVREELADLVASPGLDAAAVQAAVDARIAALSALRTRMADAAARIHATLEPDQRAALATIVRRGGHRHHRCAHGHT